LKQEGAGGRVRMETIWIGEVSHLIASASPSSSAIPGSSAALQPSSFDHEAFCAHLLAHVPTEFGLLFCSPSSTRPTPPEQPWAVWTCLLSEDGWEAVHWDEVAWKEILAGALEGLNGSATSWGRVDSLERSFLVDVSESFSFLPLSKNLLFALHRREADRLPVVSSTAFSTLLRLLLPPTSPIQITSRPRRPSRVSPPPSLSPSSSSTLSSSPGPLELWHPSLLCTTSSV